MGALNKRLLERLQLGGEAFLTSTELGGRFVLRACIVNYRSTRSDIDRMLAAIRAIGRELVAAHDASRRDPPIDPRFRATATDFFQRRVARHEDREGHEAPKKIFFSFVTPPQPADDRDASIRATAQLKAPEVELPATAE